MDTDKLSLTENICNEEPWDSKIGLLRDWGERIAECGRNGGFTRRETKHHLLGMSNALSVMLPDGLYEDWEAFLKPLLAEFGESAG